MIPSIQDYNNSQSDADKVICDTLATIITTELPEAEGKVWHAHPVWCLEGNPVVGYSKQKPGVRLMFWSGIDFEEPGLVVKRKKFKDASVFYTDIRQINQSDLKRWLAKSRQIQWDYKNIVKRKGQLERIEVTNTSKERTRFCVNGHTYTKKSDCLTCPFCERERSSDSGFLAVLSSPVRRALEYAGISTLKQLADHTEQEILKLHGIGKASIPTLQKELAKEGLAFKSEY